MLSTREIAFISVFGGCMISIFYYTKLRLDKNGEDIVKIYDANNHILKEIHNLRSDVNEIKR